MRTGRHKGAWNSLHHPSPSLSLSVSSVLKEEEIEGNLLENEGESLQIPDPTSLSLISDLRNRTLCCRYRQIVQRLSDSYFSIQIAMQRRAVTSNRRAGSFPFAGALHSKSKSSPLLSIALVVLGAFLLFAFAYSGSGFFGGDWRSFSKYEGDFSCTTELQRAIPILKKVYGDSMRKVLHVGPDTCSVVSKLLKEEETEVWGVEPYDIEDADRSCKSLMIKGNVRVADIKFPLPYRAKSFSLVIVSDALDYLSPKYLNKTLPELARVSSDGLVIFTGSPGQQRAKVAELSKFGRPAKMRSSSWWIRFFIQTSLEENYGAAKKFEQAASKKSYKPSCQVFHLNSYH